MLSPVEFRWTDERVEILRERWALGESCRQIAAAVGAPSRSSVIGKAHRLGLPQHSPAVKDANHRSATPRGRKVRGLLDPRPAKRPKPNNLAAVNRARRAAGKPRPLPEPPPMLDATHAKPWTERAFGECAYPISGEGADTFSCCAPSPGGTYCAPHRQVMFARPTAPPVKFHPIPRRVAA